MKKRVLSLLVSAFSMFVSSATVAKSETLLVFAASSLRPVLEALKGRAVFDANVEILVSYGSSSQLARQIQLGAPADLFLSADTRWAELLQEKLAGDAVNFATNALYVVTSHSDHELQDQFPFDLLADERVVVGRTRSVPVGIYAKEALQSLGVWQGVSKNLLETHSAQASVAVLTARQARFGIVYSSDLAVNPSLQPLFAFPEDAHRSIDYTALPLVHDDPKTQSFIDKLTSETAGDVFLSLGFLPAKE
ncbi:MAG: molybdate ABC transporter substrate-binding protein [Pseudomonadota bacterium]